MKTLADQQVGREVWRQPCGEWDWSGRKSVMAIINATPDSFSADGLFAGQNVNQDQITERLLQALLAGADILDIGAESTRPGSETISAATQITRLSPVFVSLEQLKQNISVAHHSVPHQWKVSLDTSSAEVAEWGLQRGAHIINDVQGGRDENLLRVVAEYRAKIVLMHNTSIEKQCVDHQHLGKSYTAEMHKDIISTVYESLRLKAQKALQMGIEAKNIAIDPGIGFGKTVADNLRLIRGCDRLSGLGYPVLIGASRKSFLGKILNLGSEDRLEANLMVHGHALMHGAQIIRVHDVAAHHRIRCMVEALERPEEFDHD